MKVLEEQKIPAEVKSLEQTVVVQDDETLDLNV